jgi:hypothetical protein
MYIITCVIVQKKYLPHVLLRAYMAAGLLGNVLKNDIEMDIIEIALMTTRTELNLVNIQS